MRVTHVITRLVVGGAQENTVATVLGLRQYPDVSVELLSGPTSGPEGSLEGAFSDSPGLLTRIPTLVRPVHPWNDLLAWRHLTKLFRARKPEIVHTHSGKAGILGRLAASAAKVRVVVHHVHGPSFGPFQGAIANTTFRSAERLAGHFTTHFICSAEAMTRLYLAAGIGRPEMYTRMFSGFKVEDFLRASNDPDLRASLGFAPDDFIVGCIARISPLKGHRDLLHVAKNLSAQLPGLRLLFVGDGPLRAEIERAALSLNIANRTVFTGVLPPSQVPRYIGIMDCVAHLSYREAVSRALPQGLAAGKPVLAYNFDGADEVCLEGRTGFVVPTGDFEAAADRLLQLAHDPAIRERFGAEGQRFVRDNFRVEQMVENIYRLYRRLLQEHGGA